MNAQELIEKLGDVKKWDPRPFIVETIDAAIAYIQAHEPQPTEAVPAEVVTPPVETPADVPTGKGKR